jgi:hypothetical protein
MGTITYESHDSLSTGKPSNVYLHSQRKALILNRKKSQNINISHQRLLPPPPPLTKSTSQFSTIDYKQPSSMHIITNPRPKQPYLPLFRKDKTSAYVTDNESER